ncbi:LamG-like jellyroll fold domain-containing protein [Paenibacillus sp. LHD-117]|uniref:LamG-like jellyroll fold domain-containing protein n=1 Tax=Paenibacillus sp. LHD-117 TaxID=3071412 RepID=UPI0027E0149B|nr:LamG-like jellyroll fold domain-containing protein [Paenibacillus sp. LHD-117]MDQ6419601.1 LamG-like jellyroll fold domain-containing protein [Paenibacillus sp. LHD-117]
MRKKGAYKISILLLACALIIPGIVSARKNQPEPAASVFQNVSVHDPSIVKDGDTFYAFGSHIDAAKSTDLINWTRFTNGYTTPNNVIFGDLSSNLAGSFAWAGENDSDSKGGYAVWAPDVFYNKDYMNKDGSKGAYMMYYSASSTYIRSAIGFAVSQSIEGPYTYGDTIVYSGFTQDEAYDNNSKVNKKWTNTNIKALVDSGKLSGKNEAWFNDNGTFNNKMYPNAIDSTMFYDKSGKLWMTYGSWSGGIFLLEIDKATGKAIYPGADGQTSDGRIIDRYFGVKIAGGYYESGEGPYIVYDKNTKYYYLYVTYGWLGADGGYNMRQFRSKNPDGPYVDAKGQNAVLPADTINASYGNKLIGNYLFDRKVGDEGTGIGVGYVSPGHNSVYIDPATGKQFLVFHSRFPQTGEYHEVRVHQMFMNKDGWPVVAPYRYTGETLSKVHNPDVVGDYKLINHGKLNSADIENSKFVTLNSNHTITGDATGSWKRTAHNTAEITLDGATYKGVFVRGWDPVSESYVMTFTALSGEGVSIWGSRQSDKTAQQSVDDVVNALDLGDTANVIDNLVLPTSGTRNTQISWQTSDASVVTDTGVIVRPAAGASSVSAVLTATISKDGVTATKAFNITVLPLQTAGLAAHFAFENDLNDASGQFAAGTATGSRIDQDGGNITYEEGKNGKAASFDGASGVRLPNGLISGDSYSVALWLKPNLLTPFTTTFFGAKDNSNWVSLVPSGPVGNNTMVWSGSGRWYDAVSGLTIPAGEWTHLAYTVDGGDIRLYVNGVEKYEGTNFPNIFNVANAMFALGVNWWDTPYQGLMDELRVYQGALTEAEVAGLNAEGK